jgi:hypothetical protein
LNTRARAILVSLVSFASLLAPLFFLPQSVDDGEAVLALWLGFLPVLLIAGGISIFRPDLFDSNEAFRQARIRLPILLALFAFALEIGPPLFVNQKIGAQRAFEIRLPFEQKEATSSRGGTTYALVVHTPVGEKLRIPVSRAYFDKVQIGNVCRISLGPGSLGSYYPWR